MILSLESWISGDIDVKIVKTNSFLGFRQSGLRFATANISGQAGTQKRISPDSAESGIHPDRAREIPDSDFGRDV